MEKSTRQIRVNIPVFFFLAERVATTEAVMVPIELWERLSKEAEDIGKVLAKPIACKIAYLQ